jgi:WD40 repeat protein/tetratricopeptide (TPR) repeat protein/predicted Ser/Thr protein kinase
MPVILTCSQGHQWSGDKPSCPVCGQAAVKGVAQPTGDLGETVSVPSPRETDHPGASKGIAPSTGDLGETVCAPARPDTDVPPAAEAGALKIETVAISTAYPSVPGYEVLRELGRGGMGVVYQARQLSLGRFVALKMILAGGQAGDEERKRFRSEAEVLARLQHPNLVQIFEVGEFEGRPFFSMEFVDGGNLEDKFEGKPQPPETAAKMASTLARAVHAAHERGVVHRDLKPGNVLLTRDGQPKITDFGLAKQMDSAIGQTRTGAIMGTPSYMAPEQASGKVHAIGPVSDVFALGSMLYEFLTGRPPFMAETGWDTILQVVHQDPLPPSKLRPHLPRDLETICLKALEKEPKKRYASAAEFADDLDRYLKHEPIKARPTGRIERLAKWIRRRPVAAALVGTALAAAIALVSLGTWYHLHLEKLNAENQRGMIRLSVVEGTQQRRAGDWYASLVWFAYALERDAGNPEREPMHRARLASTLREVPRLVQLWSHSEPVNHGSFSPDGKLVVTASNDDTAVVRDVATGQTLATLHHHGDVVQAWFSPDPEGRWVLTASRDGTARVWQARTGRAVTLPLRHGAPLRCAYFNHDATLVVTAGNDQRARIFSVKEDGPAGEPVSHERNINWAVFSPDGKWLATASEDHSARIWDVATRQPITPPLVHDAAVTQVAFSPDSKVLASCGNDQMARLWRVGPDIPLEQRRIAALRHEDPVKWASFSPDSQRVLTVSEDRTAKIWSVADGRLDAPPLVHGSDVRRYAAFTPDGCWVLTASDDNTGRVWDAHTGKPATTTLTHNGLVHATVGSPNGHTVLTVSDDRSVRLWDLASGTLLRSKTASHAVAPRAPTNLTSPNGKHELEVKDREVRVVTLAGEPVSAIMSHDEKVELATFSPDGKWIVTATSEGTVRVWDAASGRPRPAPGGNGQVTMRLASVVNAVAFTPDNRRLATASNDNTAQIFDLATGELLIQPMRHEGSVNDVTFSPDSVRLATAGNDRTARVWDTVVGTALTPPLEHPHAVLGVRFSPDGHSLITTTSVGRQRTWDLPTDERPIGELVELSRLLAGSYIARSGAYMPVALEGQLALWARLRGKQPEFIAATGTEVNEWHRRRAEECEAEHRWKGTLWHVDRLIAAEPDNWRDRLQRGSALGELARWEPAIADYAFVVEKAPQRAEAVVRLALLRLETGDEAAFLTSCRAALKQFDDPGVAPDDAFRVAWLCDLVPQEGLDRARVVTLAERAANSDAKSDRYLSTLGGALLRAGRTEEAITKLQDAVSLHGKGGTAEQFFFLALAHHRLGHASEAQRWLRQAREDQANALALDTLPWTRRLELKFLSTEAGKAVGDK